MKILIAGSSGFIGSALVPYLKSQGHEVIRLVRNAPKGSDILWDPQAGHLANDAIENFDAVINLAGENIGDGRWTTARKKKILDSRVNSTKLIAETIAKLKSPPKVWLNGSSVGFYGNTGDTLVREGSPLGQGFLAEVTHAWEEAAKPAEGLGVRIVMLRTGAVLGKDGGMLKKLLLPFKLGLGGVLGSGHQYLSWITLQDWIHSIPFLLEHNIQGPVNLVTPRPVTNYEFTKALGQVLGRPTFFAVPSFAVRLAFGEMADELILSSSRVDPQRLKDAGYPFQYPELLQALKASI